jgi:CheY-like chemotaxis protein
MANILVIDDDTQMCDLIKMILRMNGHQIRIAHDGIEGIKLYREKKPDLILTDVIMPNQDGIQMVMELKQIDKTIPIIVMSGGRRSVTAEFNLESAELLGVHSTLKKPFTQEQLLEVVKTALTSS